MLDAVRALAAVAQAAVDVRARRAHAAAVPALARHGRRDGESVAGVGLREERQLVSVKRFVFLQGLYRLGWRCACVCV